MTMMSRERGVGPLLQSCYANHAHDLGKHTSMTKEASRAIKDLKNKRKAKEERATQRVSSLFRSDVGSKG
jgi:RNA polymerase-associated protein RTF1